MSEHKYKVIKTYKKTSSIFAEVSEDLVTDLTMAQSLIVASELNHTYTMLIPVNDRPLYVYSMWPMDKAY